MRISTYLNVHGVESRLLFARGAVLVFVSQLLFVSVLLLISVIERWLRLRHPALGPEFGAGRIVWLVVMFAIVLVGMIAQLYSIKLLTRSVKPWSAHSIPAILCILLATAGFTLLVGMLTLLLHRVG